MCPGSIAPLLTAISSYPEQLTLNHAGDPNVSLFGNVHQIQIALYDASHRDYLEVMLSDLRNFKGE